MRIGIDARKIADYGIGTYIRGLVGALADIGGGHTYVAFAPAGAPLPRGVEHVITDAPHYSVRELFTIGRAADAAQLDLFHAPHYVVPFTKTRVVVTIHDLIHLHHPPRNPLAPLYARTMLRRAVRKAARVLTVSETVKRELIAELGCDAAKIAVTPNGIDSIFFGAAGLAPPWSRDKSGGASPAAPTFSRYFFYAGNDKPHKDVGTLVDAFTRAALPDVSLVLAGAPFERFHAVPNVIAAGFVSIEELAALYRGALAVVVPSREEGFGLPAAEAMACGAPVITSNASALVEITGDAALHVDAREWSDALRRIAGDGALRASLAARGIDRARKFTWSRCAESTLAAYEASLR
ncbi:MAG TPA: glycosyltransferase family 1 protein [Thermoanaerobaculia bacterium]|nr:glycosyltransferase family 1 protein [Thermoanaerobaculia bacterium]